MHSTQHKHLVFTNFAYTSFTIYLKHIVRKCTSRPTHTNSTKHNVHTNEICTQCQPALTLLTMIDGHNHARILLSEWCRTDRTQPKNASQINVNVVRGVCLHNQDARQTSRGHATNKLQTSQVNQDYFFPECYVNMRTQTRTRSHSDGFRVFESALRAFNFYECQNQHEPDLTMAHVRRDKANKNVSELWSWFSKSHTFAIMQFENTDAYIIIHRERRCNQRLCNICMYYLLFSLSTELLHITPAMCVVYYDIRSRWMCTQTIHSGQRSNTLTYGT